MELTQKGEMVSRLQAKASQIGKILNNLEKYNHLLRDGGRSSHNNSSSSSSNSNRKLTNSTLPPPPPPASSSATTTAAAGKQTDTAQSSASKNEQIVPKNEQLDTPQKDELISAPAQNQN